ncbi:MAG: ABC transporter substrate-binding protein [Rubrivivax sp.]|nr:ABC transporter substrate-binding protein [Rubrivivax sp.]
MNGTPPSGETPTPPSTASGVAPAGPVRIVALTEETTEWLYLLGEEHRLVGISGYTVRPRRARLDKPRVSAFLDGKIDRIVALEPDLVIGFSDMQAALADKLIRLGLNVLVTNQRSVEEIFSTLRLVALLIGAQARAQAWIEQCRSRHAEIARAAAAWPRRPRVYFEEWDAPMISAIRWVSELIALAGGDDVFPELALRSLGKDRVIADAAEPARRAPDVIVGSWCGKKFRAERVAARPGWHAVPAVRDGELHEVKSCDILQPGPAALTDGLEQLHRLLARWVHKHPA